MTGGDNPENQGAESGGAGIASSNATFLQRRIVVPLVGQLKQGATPRKLAQSLTWGGLIGIFPILGTSTAVCGIAAVAFKLNHIAIQLLNWLVYPLQLVLIIPFLKLGNAMFGAEQTSLTLTEITTMFAENFLGGVERLGLLAIRGAVAWLVVAVPLSIALTKILEPPIRRLQSRTGIRSEQP